MNSNDVLKRILDTFPKEHKSRGYLKLPSDIQFSIIGEKEVEMIISKDALGMNMQDDNASFEGWALIMLRWGRFDKVFIKWEHQSFDKKTPAYGHYQRFLFRVLNFSRDFANWFCISPTSVPFLAFLDIDEHKTYYLNSPSKDRCTENEPQGKEGKLEYRYTCKDWSEYLKREVKAEFLFRQLPVGVFKDPEDSAKKKVSKENSIFARGKSAIDIVGVRGNELLLIELKAKDNVKVGIITELYFYCCVMKRVQSCKFQYERVISPLNWIVDTRRIVAYFMAPELHPLINDAELMRSLNKGTEPDVEFHYLSFKDGIGNSLKIEF